LRTGRSGGRIRHTRATRNLYGPDRVALGGAGTARRYRLTRRGGQMPPPCVGPGARL